MVYLDIKGAVNLLFETLIKLNKKRVDQQKGSVTVFNAYKYILSSSSSVQISTQPRGLKISNNMVHASKFNYRYNVRFTP